MSNLNPNAKITVEEAEALGFKMERKLELGTEYQAICSEAIIEDLELKGFVKTWGHEGGVNCYATFKCDNKEHEDFGKVIISIYAV